ncbi:MAG: hypothetical protein N2712_02345 [Brevinematales bacterium]|nr:hypothetical protein [Brevinematales bacterium]
MKNWMFVVGVSTILVFSGCSLAEIPFEIELGPYSNEIRLTGVYGTEFWAESSFGIGDNLEGVSINEVRFNFKITNQTEYDTKLTLVWSLSGVSNESKVVIYTSTPSYINQDNENRVFVYIFKDLLVKSNASTNLSVTVSKVKFLEDFTKSNMYWITLKNTIQGLFIGYSSDDRQELEFTMNVKGTKRILNR